MCVLCFFCLFALLVNRKATRQTKGDNAKRQTQTHKPAHAPERLTFCTCIAGVLVLSVRVCEGERLSVFVKKRHEETN